ncbi:MAG: phosphoribosyl-AMP cyclohydrolase [Puniceicoccales bacterium]|jgi:phosphoribosyl-AMP cyclohydrolase|nr:phosphoribosyl-AMP cyclohydrolase [Puniceicoccales bacterium]
MSHSEIEEGTKLTLDFGKLRKVVTQCSEDVIPAVAQDVDSGEVLIVGYVNKLALETAIREKMATFWSTSRNELWIKGKTSGNYLAIQEIRINCEQNSVLYRVKLAGTGACHTNSATGAPRLGCYYRRLKDDGINLEFRDNMK